MNNATVKQMWFLILCLCAVTYLNASSANLKNTNDMVGQDVYGVVYQCDTPNLVEQGLCRDYGRVERTKAGLTLHINQTEVRHITIDQKPLISKNPVGYELVGINNPLFNAMNSNM